MRPHPHPLNQHQVFCFPHNSTLASWRTSRLSITTCGYISLAFPSHYPIHTPAIQLAVAGFRRQAGQLSPIRRRPIGRPPSPARRSLLFSPDGMNNYHSCSSCYRAHPWFVSAFQQSVNMTPGPLSTLPQLRHETIVVPGFPIRVQRSVPSPAGAEVLSPPRTSGPRFPRSLYLHRGSRNCRVPGLRNHAEVNLDGLILTSTNRDTRMTRRVEGKTCPIPCPGVISPRTRRPWRPGNSPHGPGGPG